MLNFNDCTFITMCKHIKMSKLSWYQSMGANRNLYRWANNILNEIATGLTCHAIECSNICDMNILFVFQLFFSQFIFELNRCPLPWWHHAMLESFHSWDPLPLSLNLKSIFHFLGALQNPSGRYYDWHTQQLLQHTSRRVMTKATHTHTYTFSTLGLWMNWGFNSQVQSGGTWFGNKVKYMRKDERSLLADVDGAGSGCCRMSDSGVQPPSNTPNWTGDFLIL